MQQWLGPIDQLGYMVDEGWATEARIAGAVSFSGALPVELIQPLDDEPTPYRDVMAVHGTGLHHGARFVGDYENAGAGYAARGIDPYFGGRGLTEKQRFAYFDTETHGGTASELIETVEFGAFFDHIRAAATDGDGSDPIRTVGG